MYNAVIRGDMNRVEIAHFCSIGENTVVHTAAALPTGQIARCEIGNNSTIGANCSLYSCYIGDDVVVGDKCVIMEGARVED